MSGIEIIGLISSIITLVDSAAQIYSAIKSAERLPPAFQAVTQRLPLVRCTLETAQEQLKQNRHDRTACEAVKPIVQSIKERAECLRDILQEVALQPDDSKLQRYRVVVRRLGKGAQVEQLMKFMLEDVHLLAANHTMKATTETQVAELVKAIQDLSKPGVSSAPKSTQTPTFTHRGTGHQYNNAGDGTQNVNTRDGRQYFANSMDFRAD
ncbi:SesA protein [Xylariaceae sp. FL0662B]|nr:SesA protein [Xylariaceae sp. FL0662B]